MSILSIPTIPNYYNALDEAEALLKAADELRNFIVKNPSYGHPGNWETIHSYENRAEKLLASAL